MISLECTYKLEEFAGRNCIIIEFEGKDNLEIIRNIKVAVDQIGVKENIDPNRYMVVYRHNEGLWNGWHHEASEFEALQCTNPYHAINRWIKQQRLAVTNSINNIMTDPKEPLEENEQENQGTATSNEELNTNTAAANAGEENQDLND